MIKTSVKNQVGAPLPFLQSTLPQLALALALFAGSVAFAAGRDRPEPTVLLNSSGFGATIPGCPGASQNILEIAIDDLTVDVREMTTGLDVEYRLYGPGAAHWGNATFTAAVTLGGSKELQAWFQEAAKGKNIRKNIMVRLKKSDKTDGRGYILHDCFPVKWSFQDAGESSKVATETLTAKIGRVEFLTAGARSGGQSSVGGEGSEDGDAPAVGFSTEIRGGAGKEVDTAWESVNGGDMVIETVDLTGESDRFKTHSPGHKTISEITLRGAMTDGRKNLCQWINDTVNGKPWKQSLTITELLSVDGAVKDGKSYNFVDCFPIRYVFPRMSVANSRGNVMEEVDLKVVRIERELPARARVRLAIPKAPIASERTLLIRVNDLDMDVGLVEKTGDARNPSATFILPRGSAVELIDWRRAIDAGLDGGRDISIEFLKGKQRPVGALVLKGAYPVSFNLLEINGALMEEVSVKPIRVELK